MQHFLRNLCERGGQKKTLSPSVLDRLMAYNWPGNIRELHNVVEQLFALSGGVEITTEYLPDTLRSSPSSGANAGVIPLTATGAQPEAHSEASRGLVPFPVFARAAGHLPRLAGAMAAGGEDEAVVCSLKEAVETYERELISRALKQLGSLRRAATILKVDHSTLVRKAQKYRIS